MDDKLHVNAEADVHEHDAGEPSQPHPQRQNYPYLQLLERLQSKAVRAQRQHDADGDEEKSDADNNKDERRKSSSLPSSAQWDLASDALLATVLHEFSRHVSFRAREVAREVRSTQNAVNEAGVDVAICQSEFMMKSGQICMELVVGDDDDDNSDDHSEGVNADTLEGGRSGDIDIARKDDSSIERNERQQKSDGADGDADGSDSDDSSANIARLEAEERSAIADGTKALSLFYDPKRPLKSNNNTSGEGDAYNEGNGTATVASPTRMAEADNNEDVIGENCYYYRSAEEDGFNQRPLPFIVGSREFMEM